MRIVLDTNIYIAATLHDGFSAYIVEVVTESPEFIVIISEEILIELNQKLRNKFNWLQEDIDRYIKGLIRIGELVRIGEKINIITRDSGDNKILECALAGYADLIVTLDQDLIKLKKFREIGIVHPKTLSWTFPDYFKKKKGN